VAQVRLQGGGDALPDQNASKGSRRDGALGSCLQSNKGYEHHRHQAADRSDRGLRYTRVLAKEGLLFLAIGTAVGALLSLILFSLTVVSFPLLLERDVDFVTAMVTSVRAVVTSPLPMIGWAAVIVVLTIVSALPYFLGLVVTLPVLGHATWHLYRRIVEPLPV